MPPDPAPTAAPPRPQAVLPRPGEAPRPPRYEPVRALGEGAFGEVTLARDNDISRLVAIKRLKDRWRQGETLARFVDEIQYVGQLEHPGIVPIHDVGLDENGYFFVMKYVEGEPLDRLIARLKAGDDQAHARYSHEARADLFLQVLQAVRFAHEHGVLHRDLKPDNIMVGPYGEVFIMDWGLARRSASAAPSGLSAAGPASSGPGPASSASPPAPLTADEAAVLAARALEGSVGGERMASTRAGSLVGTPAYMSPEQARGRLDLVDERSDLYSLAAVFYELLTLDHYLPRKPSVQLLMVAVMVEEPLAATAIHHRYGIPPEFTFFLRKGLEKDPSKRFQSAREMADQLRAILDGHIPVQCPCTGLKAAGNRWFDFIDAHPIAAVIAAVVAVVCAINGVVSFIRMLM